MVRTLFLTLLAVLVALCATPPTSSLAAVPPLMSYQGKLTDSAGQPVSDGAYNMRFYLWSAESEGTVLWQEPAIGTRPAQVSGGLFNVLLGSVVALPESAFQGST